MNHFIDGGSNIGQTFDDYLTRDPRFDGWHIWLLEPSPRHIPALMAKAASLRDRYQIHLCPFGLAGETSVRRFYEKSDPRGDSFEASVWADHEQHNLTPGYELLAPAIGISDFLAALPAATANVILKLDVEGAEYEILDALLECWRRPRITEILVEWHTLGTPPRMSAAQLTAYYAAVGLPLGKWMF